jgi:plastocyanin
MKVIVLLFILVSGVVLNMAYADSSLVGIKGSGIALLNSDLQKMYTSSIRIFLYNQTSVASGLVIISTDQGTILAKMVPNEWQFAYNKDGSFHGTGPAISRQGMSYDVSLDGTRLIASGAGSLWKIGAEMSSNGQNYLLEYLVSGRDPLGNTISSLIASVTIPNGNAAQSNTGFFVPLNLEILRGTTVTWQNQDNIGHTVQSIDDKGNIIPMFNSPVLKTGDAFSHKFDRPGVYHYYCSIHPWRIGVVTIS